MSVFGDPLLSRLASPFETANDAAESTSGPTLRVFIKSFGCQMNVYDSQRMADLAVGQGYRETQTIAEADLVILNTCHIRERARRRAERRRSWSPAASRRPKAAKSSAASRRSTSSSVRRVTTVCRLCC